MVQKLYVVPLFGILLLLLSASSYCQDVLRPNSNAVTVSNSLTVAAAAVGIRTCGPALESLSNIGVSDSLKNDVLFDWDRNRPNLGLVFALLGLDMPGGRGAALSVSAAPQPDGSCAVMAERISVSADVCSKVAKRELTGYSETKLLSQMTVFTSNSTPGSTVSLIDSAPGCLIIRRYINFALKQSRPGRQ